MKLITAGNIESISTRADGTIKVTMGTQELDASQCAELFRFRNKYVKLLITEDEITQLDSELVTKLKLAAPAKKKPSERLRAVMYRAWEQKGLSIEFDAFYAAEMESIIDSYKLELE